MSKSAASFLASATLIMKFIVNIMNGLTSARLPNDEEQGILEAMVSLIPRASEAGEGNVAPPLQQNPATAHPSKTSCVKVYATSLNLRAPQPQSRFHRDPHCLGLRKAFDVVVVAKHVAVEKTLTPCRLCALIS